MEAKNVVFGLIVGSLALVEGLYLAERIRHPDRPVRFTSLRREQGKELDRRFVEALISRYKDTMELAEEERTKGHNPELKKLAAALVESRRNDLALLLRLTTADAGQDAIALKP